MMHVTVSAMGMPASRPLLRNHGYACHGICCPRPRSHHLDSVHKKDLMGQIQASVSSYICMCVLSFFLCYNKGKHTMDGIYVPTYMCSSLSRCMRVPLAS